MTQNHKHPRLWARGTNSAAAPDTAASKLVVLVYTPESHVSTWVEAELDRAGAVIQIARSMRALIHALVEDPSSRPHVLVIDIDALRPAELMELHSVRHVGWFGSLIGVGRVPVALRTSLGLDHVVPAPLVDRKLCDAITTLRTPIPTVRIPVMRELR